MMSWPRPGPCSGGCAVCRHGPGGVFRARARHVPPAGLPAGAGEANPAGLAGLGLPRPSEEALRDLRRRIGPAPLKALFEIVAGPLDMLQRS